MASRFGVSWSAPTLAVWVAIVLPLALAGVARAQPKPIAPRRVEVMLPECPQEPFPFEPSIVALRIELAVEGVERVERARSGATPDGARIEIAADCIEGASLVTVRVIDPRTSGASRLTELSDVPEAHRPRALALVAAELARSVWSRPHSLSTNAAPPGEATPPSHGAPRVPSATHARRPAPVRRVRAPPDLGRTRPPAAGPSPAPPALPPGVWVAPSVAGRLFVPEATAVGGANLRLGWRRVRLAVEGLAGVRDDELGSIAFGLVSGSLGVDALSHGGEMGRLRAGARASIGIALAAGQPGASSRATRAQEPYVDAALELGAEARMARRITGFFDLEAGVARGLDAYADTQRIAGIGGVFVGTRLGLAFRL